VAQRFSAAIADHSAVALATKVDGGALKPAFGLSGRLWISNCVIPTEADCRERGDLQVKGPYVLSIEKSILGGAALQRCVYEDALCGGFSRW